MLLLQLKMLDIRKYHRNEFWLNEELINVFIKSFLKLLDHESGDTVTWRR